MRKLVAVLAAIAALHTAPAMAVPRDAVQRAQASFSEQLTLHCGEDDQAYWITEDAVYEYSLGHINLRFSIQGRDAVVAHLCTIPEVNRPSPESIRFFPTLDPDVVFVQYEVRPGDAVGHTANALAIIEMRGYQISRFTQLNRSEHSLEALLKLAKRMN